MAEKKQPETLSTFNLSDVETESGLLKAIFRLHDVGKMGCIPAIVVSYDYTTKIARVKPLLKFLKLTTEGVVGYERPMYDVPVYSVSQGGFRIDLPLFPGNTGMLFAVDRDCETAKEMNSTHLAVEEDPEKGDENKNKGPQNPDSYALADFQFGFFLPMTFGGGSEEDKGKIILRRITEAGDDTQTLSIEVSEKSVKAQVSTEESGTILSEVDDSGVKISVGDESYAFNKDGLTFDGKADEEFSVVTAMRYDVSSHQIQSKTRSMKRRGTFIVNIGDETDWTMIDGGQAVPESTE